MFSIYLPLSQATKAFSNLRVSFSKCHTMILPVYLSFLFSLSFAASSRPPTPSQPTTFHVTSGSNENYFFRDNITTAQVLLTSSSASSSIPRRFVAALPAGNNGALVYFLPSGNSTTLLNVELVNGTMKSATGENGNKGIQADIRLSSSTTLGVVIVGAVRAMRDYVEGSGTMHEIFNYTLLSSSATQVRLHRQYINSTASTSLSHHPIPNSASGASQNGHHEQQVFKSVDLYFTVPPGSSARFSVQPSTNGGLTLPVINIIVPTQHGAPTLLPIGSESGNSLGSSDVRVQVMTNESSLVGFDVQDLFLTPDEASTNTLKTVLQNLPGNVIDQVSFLTFQDKFTAGGWRFLTYFGRDSLIALRMLMPLLTSDAIEAALGAVIERANSTGALCHEETIGDYASFVNIGNGHPELGNTPFYDYKMIDTDLLLMPALAHYFLDLPQGQNRSSQFLAKQATLQNGTYLDIVNRIVSYNINRAMPFFTASPATHEQLLAFRPSQPVGNWRDSNQGTGYGPIPFDVNVALVPANLRAVEGLVVGGVLSINGMPDLVAMAEKWEQEVPGMFEVTVDHNTAEGRLADFVNEVGLDASLLGNSSSQSGNVSFYSLSLMADGSPVEVLNSDLGFNLMYGTNVSATFMQHVADALVDYPRGLLTNVGMVVANPAYDSNRTNVQVLDRTAYHGTVVWSFQQALMAGGLARQLGFCQLNLTTVDINPRPSVVPEWCADTTLVQNLQAAQSRLWDAINGASSNIYSEVWSYSFDSTTNTFSVADLAAISPQGTESDAIQLWSYGFLGLVEPQ